MSPSGSTEICVPLRSKEPPTVSPSGSSRPCNAAARACAPFIVTGAVLGGIVVLQSRGERLRGCVLQRYGERLVIVASAAHHLGGSVVGFADVLVVSSGACRGCEEPGARASSSAAGMSNPSTIGQRKTLRLVPLKLARSSAAALTRHRRFAEGNM